MIDKTRIERLEAKLRRTGRVNVALAGLLIAGLAGAAMQGAGQVSRGTFTVTTIGGKPTGTVLSENGDVEVGGKLLVQKTDILAELKKPPLEPQGELQVLELRFLTPPDQIAARYSLGCDCRSCLASTFRPVGVSIFSASSFSSRCSAS